jgi:hypothetical protein
MTGQTLRKGALLDSGTPSPNPWDLSLSRQNVCSTMKALERRIGLRRDATRAPIQGPEWQGAGSHSRPQNSTPRPRRALAYCGQKMVLTMGSTLDVWDQLGASPAHLTTQPGMSDLMLLELLGGKMQPPVTEDLEAVSVVSGTEPGRCTPRQAGVR